MTHANSFGPITDKLASDLLSAGVRLTTQFDQDPARLARLLQAFTVEITTALTIAVGQLEQTEIAAAAPDFGPVGRPRVRHLRPVPSNTT